MDSSGPPPFAAWSRSSFSVNDDRPADRNQMNLIPTRPAYYGSATSWTSNGSEADDPFTDSRGGSSSTLPRQNLLFQEYNRLAEKRGLRPLSHAGDDDDQDGSTEHDSQTGERRNWFARTFGKPSAPTSRRSSRHSIGGGKHRRSDSDPTNQLQNGTGSKSDVLDTLKNQSLQTLIRTCGKSFLYLPTDYATRSLMLPTCFRAAAQYLVQNGPETRGIFRISGSMRVVNELYDYYCISLDDDEDIAATVRSPNLPFHIKASVHDVASMFKRLLKSLPGGILGNLRLFEAFVEILKSDGHSSNEVLESGKADPAQMKARLIALAIGSVPGPLQRELMCAVFGLLSLIGYSAETEEPIQGSSVPHSEMMGYAALGIIFGPLLIGELLESYSAETNTSRDSSISASPSGNPSFQGTPSPRSKTDKRRKSMASDKQSLANLPSTLDKILLANDVAEMLITKWRAIVYEMKHMGIMRKESMLQHPHQQPARVTQPLSRSLRPSRSETFTDHNMGSMVQQALQLYSSNLRKTRSASNTRNANDAMSVKQPPSNSITSQRPADMSFEEFAARKRLRNYASNMSIASDSTYSAIEPQPVKPLSPPVEDPFYVPGSIAISTRSGAAKLTKQRRASGGFSSIFGGDKATSPTKDLPKIARKAVNSHSDSRSLASEGGDKVASPLNVPLSPTKVRSGVPHQTNDTRKTSGSPRKATPTRSYHRSDPVDTCRSEPAGRVGIGGTPQSKTAALIAKIMNTKQPPPTPTPVKKAKATSDLSRRDEKTQRASHDTPRIFESKSASTSPIKSHGTWIRGNASSATKSENRPIESTGIVSPTPRRPWKAQASASFLAHGRGSPRSNLARSSDSPTSRLADTTGGLGRQSPMPRSNRAGKPSVTPQRQRKSMGGSGTGLVKGGVVGLKSEERSAKHTAQEQRAIVQLINDTASPLSEIKNDARGIARTNSNSSRASKRTQTDGLANSDPKSPGIGSSVKAMAAMFDTAAWKSSEPLPLTNPQVAKPRTPKRGSALSQYTSNTSPSKSADFVTPPYSPIQPKLGVFDKIEARGTDSSAMQRTASERRRMRLTKGEGRNGPLGKVGRLAANERRELARSVDRNEVKTEVGRRTPFGPKDNATQSKDSSSSTFQTSGGHTTTLPALDNISSLARGGTPVSSRSKSKPVSAVLPVGRSTSVTELRRLLDNKTTECERWKTRAEAAEAKVAELELALAGASVNNGSRLDSFVSVTEQGSDLSWAWQNLLPETDSIHLSHEKLEMSSVVREIGETDDAMPAPLNTVSRLRKDFETDDGNGSETIAGSVARGRLVNKRLMPFSM